MNQENLIEREDVRELVKRKYGEAALKVINGSQASCCGGSSSASATGLPERLVAIFTSEWLWKFSGFAGARVRP